MLEFLLLFFFFVGVGNLLLHTHSCTVQSCGTLSCKIDSGTDRHIGVSRVLIDTHDILASYIKKVTCTKIWYTNGYSSFLCMNHFPKLKI